MSTEDAAIGTPLSPDECVAIAEGIGAQPHIWQPLVNRDA